MQNAAHEPSPPHEDSAPRFDDPDDFDRARAMFAAADYTEPAVARLTAYSVDRAPREAELGGCLWRTRDATPLAVLVRLFHLGVPVAVEDARRALAPVELDRWIAARLIALHDSQVVPRVRVTPFRDLLLVSDRLRSAFGRKVPFDFVMGIGGSTQTVANAMLCLPFQRALDLGTGCGVLAFLAARHCELVCGADRNTRAIQLARFNARLNGVANVDFVCGDLFEPVAGRQFDLIIGNPPFVVSPTTSYMYRDSGREGDRLSWQIAEQAPRHLAEGGYCQLLVNFAQSAGDDWQARLASRLTAAGCDALFLRGKSHAAADYAALWLQSTEFGNPLELAEKFALWTDYYQRYHIEAIVTGCLVLRRRSGANFVRFVEEPEKMIGPGGVAVLEMFRCFDFLAGLPSADALLDEPLRAAPDVRLLQECETAGDGWRQTATRLHLIRGFAFVANSDPFLATLLARCDGQRPLRLLVRELAETLGLPFDQVVQAALPPIRGFIERGFLLPSDSQASQGV